MGSFQWWFGIQMCIRYPPCSQPCLSHLWSLWKKLLLLPSEPGVWLMASLGLKALDRGFRGFLVQGHRLCLGFKFGMHQTEDYWISSQPLSCLCSPPLLQAANCLHPTWVLVEEHKRAKSANPLNMTVRQLSVLLPFAVAHCKS